MSLIEALKAMRMVQRTTLIFNMRKRKNVVKEVEEDNNKLIKQEANR
jgi:hypothetical protein